MTYLHYFTWGIVFEDKLRLNSCFVLLAWWLEEVVIKCFGTLGSKSTNWVYVFKLNRVNEYKYLTKLTVWGKCITNFSCWYWLLWVWWGGRKSWKVIVIQFQTVLPKNMDKSTPEHQHHQGYLLSTSAPLRSMHIWLFSPNPQVCYSPLEDHNVLSCFFYFSPEDNTCLADVEDGEWGQTPENATDSA